MGNVFVLLGPTSSGKTSLAIKLCKQLGGVIVSADSRQIYKEMDVGTGKVPVTDKHKIEKLDDHWLIDGVRVFGYDLAVPDEFYTVYDYAQWAIPTINKWIKSKNVFLVGGTGFYIDIVTGRKKVAGAKPDFELRRSFETISTKDLVTWLMSLNPEVAERVDQKNRARVVRALEIELTNEKNPTPLPQLDTSKCHYLGLSSDRDYLYEKVDSWLDEVWDGGLLAETGMLLEKYPNSRTLYGLVYKSVVSFLEGEDAEDTAKQQAKYDLHAYIRRQLTYFKKNTDVKWFDITDNDFYHNVLESCKIRIDG